MWQPTKPTPSEYIVLIAFAAVVLIIIGIAALVVGFREPPEKHDVAVFLEHRGVWCLAGGAVMVFVLWLGRRLSE